MSNRQSDDNYKSSSSTSTDDDDLRIIKYKKNNFKHYIYLVSILTVATIAYFSITSMMGISESRQSNNNPETNNKITSTKLAYPNDPELIQGQTNRISMMELKKISEQNQADPRLDLVNYLKPGEMPTAKDVIERLHDAGIYSGIGAFNPPGTSPILSGIAVPENYNLPEGYVRHYQATDDGRRVEPILMFSPDYEFFDTDGNPIDIPDDRVVPPELIPDDLNARIISIPESADQQEF